MQVATALHLALTLTPRAALARTAARLEHSREEGARACPEAPLFAAKVAERLGYDPFRAEADAAVRVAFAGQGGALRATVEMHDVRGVLVGRRELTSDDATCADLAEGVVLTVSILLDTPRLPAGERAAAASPLVAVDVVPAPAPETPLVARLGAAAVSGFGFAPAPSAGFSIFAGIARGPWSADLEGRADFPAGAAFGVGSVRTAVRMGLIVPCGHVGVGFACLVLGLGAISADGVDLKSPQHTTGIYSVAGARLGMEIRVTGPLYARLSARAVVP